MNDALLHAAWRKLAVPPPDAAAREKARRRAEIAFANRPSPAAVPPGEAEMPGRRWGAVLAAVCAVAAVVYFGRLDWKQPASPASQDLAERTLLAEMEALFPGQLDGVIATGGKVSLALASTPSLLAKPPAQRLAVTFQRGRQVVRVFGYSGRKVHFTLDGRSRSVEPLVTGDGSVIVEGEDFLSTDAHPAKVDGYRVKARLLAL